MLGDARCAARKSGHTIRQKHVTHISAFDVNKSTRLFSKNLRKNVLVLYGKLYYLHGSQKRIPFYFYAQRQIWHVYSLQKALLHLQLVSIDNAQTLQKMIRNKV